MAESALARRITEQLPTVYFLDPLIGQVVGAVAGRLIEAQLDLHQVLHAHWVDLADGPTTGLTRGLRDLPLIGALVPLTPLDDEESAQSGAQLYRQRLKLTVEAFLQGAGTAPAILQMVAATMGWGSLLDAPADWSAGWTPTDPVFTALAEAGPAPIRLREQPLRPARTPVPQRLKAGGRWLETGTSPLVVQPSIVIRALDLPVLIPTIVSLDRQAAIAALVVLETVKLDGDEVVNQDVTLRIEGRPDGTLDATLIERRLPQGGVTVTDVSDRIRLRTSGLRVDHPGASALLQGGTDEAAASLVIADARRVLRLVARGQGRWGNGVEVAYGGDGLVALTFDPALAVDQAPSTMVTRETLGFDELLNGVSLLVQAEAVTFTVPAGESRWLYFDHVAWGMFDFAQWDRIVFDTPPEDEPDPELRFRDYPSKGIYDFGAFDAAVYPQEFLRAFRFDEPGSVYDGAFYNETPEQVEIRLAWQEGQPATIQVSLSISSEQDRRRLPVLPGMIRRIKAAGVKVLLAPRFVEAQPLGERPPVARPRGKSAQPLGESVQVRSRSRRSERQPSSVRMVGVFNESLWDGFVYETR